MNKKDDKRAKLMQEKCNTILNQLLRDDDNKYCCDCDQKSPRWASWNLGIFLCIRCAGIHRNLGVHISRVKSVNLDTWSPEQVVCLQQMGNSRARAVYEALLSDNFRRPQTDSGLESFIRAKYEQKKYIAREWIPPPFPPDVTSWDKEIDEELENQKRKKKSTSSISIPEPPVTKQSPVANIIPAPLPKPHSSPKNSRADAKKSSLPASVVATTLPTTTSNNNNCDLLGLDSSSSNASSSIAPPSQKKPESTLADTFDFFSDSSVAAPTPVKISATPQMTTKNGINETSSLKQEEDDFFNQKSIENGSGEKGKLTKDNILALYGNTSSLPFAAPNTQSQFQNANFPPQQDIAAFNFFGPTGSNPLYKAQTQAPPQPQPQQFNIPMGQPPAMMFNGNYNNFGFGTMQSQQINKLNEENIRKIESLNFNNFK